MSEFGLIFFMSGIGTLRGFVRNVAKILSERDGYTAEIVTIELNA